MARTFYLKKKISSFEHRLYLVVFFLVHMDILEYSFFRNFCGNYSLTMEIFRTIFLTFSNKIVLFKITLLL